MPEVLNWQNTPDPHELLRRAVEALAAGLLIGVPTEIGHAIAVSGLHPDAVGRLPEGPASLAVRGLADALAWVPNMSRIGRRLARRCWPGPVTLAFPDAVQGGVAGQLTDPVRQRVCPDGLLRLRAAHEVPLHILGLTHESIVLVDGGPTDALDLVIEDAPAPYTGSATVIEVTGDTWRVLQPGLVVEEALREHLACLVAFVCTGNTCRSPMAEALCKKQLAERLGCTVDELSRRGFLVISAGVAAMMGGAAAEEAMVIAAEHGADLSQHQSQTLGPTIAAQADYLVVMTQGHQRVIEEGYRHLAPNVRLLSPTGVDLPDPVGADLSVYRECGRQIADHLRGLVAELTEGIPPP